MDEVCIEIRKLIAFKILVHKEEVKKIPNLSYPNRIMREFLTSLLPFLVLPVLNTPESLRIFSIYSPKSTEKNYCVLWQTYKYNKIGCRNVMFAYKVCITAGNIYSWKITKNKEEKKGNQIIFKK